MCWKRWEDNEKEDYNGLNESLKNGGFGKIENKLKKTGRKSCNAAKSLCA